MSFFWDPTPTLLSTDLRYPAKSCHAVTPDSNNTRCGRVASPETAQRIDSLVIAMSQTPPDQVSDSDLGLLASMSLCPHHRFEEHDLEMTFRFRLSTVLRGYYQFQGIWQEHWETLNELRTRLGITAIHCTKEEICNALESKLLQMGAMHSTIDRLMREALARENILLAAQGEILRLSHCLSKFESNPTETRSEMSIANLEKENVSPERAVTPGELYQPIPTRHIQSFWGDEDLWQTVEEQSQEMASHRRTRTE